ncbi:MAG: efflux RND transporter periplasmic adaptor subunit [Spirochaetales bacterium]
MKHTRLLGIAFFGVAAIFLASCSGQDADAASEATADMVMDQVQQLGPLAVEGVAAQETTIVGDIVASGVIRGSREVNLVSETQGVIEQVGFELGQSVTRGRLLVGLDTSIQRLSVQEAQEAVASARTDVSATERLVNSGSASQADLSRARSALAGAEARLAQAQKALADRTLVAPFEGVVASKHASVEVGNFLTAGLQVARIIDLAELEVELSVGEREVQLIEVGAPAFIEFPAASKDAVEAEVVAIAAGSDPQTGSFPVIIRWTNNAGSQARAGLSARVRIPPVNVLPQIVVPANALVNRNGQPSLFVAQDGTASLRPVEPGERLGDRLAIRSGIEPGEIVVVTGLRTLSDGDEIDVTERATLLGGDR